MEKITGCFMMLLLAGMLFLGCAKTIQETKATDTDTGNITQLKFTGSNVKVVHGF